MTINKDAIVDYKTQNHYFKNLYQVYHLLVFVLTQTTKNKSKKY